MKSFVFMLLENIVIGMLIGLGLYYFGYIKQIEVIGSIILTLIVADIGWDYGVVPLYKRYKANKQLIGDR